MSLIWILSILAVALIVVLLLVLRSRESDGAGGIGDMTIGTDFVVDISL